MEEEQDAIIELLKSPIIPPIITLPLSLSAREYANTNR